MFFNPKGGETGERPSKVFVRADTVQSEDGRVWLESADNRKAGSPIPAAIPTTMTIRVGGRGNSTSMRAGAECSEPMIVVR